MNKIAACLSTALLLLFSAASAGADASGSVDREPEARVAGQERQNVVMVIVDDLRPVLGAYGDKNAHTPHIDALAARGVTFRHAYANVPVCGASRASMLTGLRPLKERFVDFRARADEDAPGAKTLPQVLRESGYHTMSIGKIFHHRNDTADASWSEPPLSSGVPHATTLNPESKQFAKPNPRVPKRTNGPWYEMADVENEDYPDGKVKEKALAALDRLAAQDEPFFLSVGFIRPHLPFNAPKKFYDLHPEEKFEPFFDRKRPHLAPDSLQAPGEIRTYHFRDYQYNSDAFHVASQRGYYASVSYVDALVGDLAERMRALGLEDNTTVVLLSDHGFHLGEHNFWGKHTLLDDSLRIPLIVAGPQFPRNQTTDALVELVDVFPTVAELTRAEAPANLDGESFLHVLHRPEAAHKTHVFSRFKQGDSVVSEGHIFTSYTTENGQTEEMLFNLHEDPHEQHNVVSDPAHRTTAERLRALLSACTEEQRCATR